MDTNAAFSHLDANAILPAPTEFLAFEERESRTSLGYGNVGDFAINLSTPAPATADFQRKNPTSHRDNSVEKVT